MSPSRGCATLVLALATAFAVPVALALGSSFAVPFALVFGSSFAVPSAAAAEGDTGCAAPDAWRDAASWQKLRRGLSRTEVVRILGDPGRTGSYAGFERWEYPDLRGGRVHFDDRGLVVGWRPPPRQRDQ